MATTTDELLRAITIEELRQLRDRWGLPATKECVGTVHTEAGDYPCSAMLDVAETNCPTCGFCFSERH